MIWRLVSHLCKMCKYLFTHTVPKGPKGFLFLFDLLLLLIIKCKFLTILRGLYQAALLLNFFLFRCSNFAVVKLIDFSESLILNVIVVQGQVFLWYIYALLQEMSYDHKASLKLGCSQTFSETQTDTTVGDDI